ncbi:MAG: MBL fold metallo-hydrolase [Christensenella sp.]
MTANDFIRLTANAGVLISYHGKKILVDALHNRYTEVFSAVPDDLLFSIAHGEGDFENIDLIVYTHDHPDHYSSEWTREFLKNHPRTKMLSPIDDFSGERFTVLSAAEETHEYDGIKVKCVRLTHEGEQFREVVNYGFRFETDGFSFTVLGDSGPVNIPGVFANADLALYNFPFITLTRGKKMVKELNPKRIAAYHLPFLQKDKKNYIRATLRAAECEPRVGTMVLREKDQKEFI